MDRLAKLIDEYHQGIIPLERLQTELEFHQWQEDAEQGRKRDAIVSTVKHNMHNSLGVLTTKTPEEIILEEERQSEILEMLEGVREVVGERDYQILTLYVVDKWTQQRIAKHFGLSQPAVFKVLHKVIREKIANASYNYPQYFTILCRDNLLPMQSQLEAHSPETRGYPFEFLQKVSVSGTWHTRQNKRTYVSKDMCLLPEYFEEAFKDNNTVCPICEKCKRQQ